MYNPSEYMYIWLTNIHIGNISCIEGPIIGDLSINSLALAKRSTAKKHFTTCRMKISLHVCKCLMMKDTSVMFKYVGQDNFIKCPMYHSQQVLQKCLNLKIYYKLGKKVKKYTCPRNVQEISKSGTRLGMASIRSIHTT